MRSLRKIGLLYGGGAGSQQAEIFERATSVLSEAVSEPIELLSCPHRSSSFTEMREWPSDEIERAVQADIRGISAFYGELIEAGAVCVFRTGINAEALYSIRSILGALKVVPIELESQRILMVRDLSLAKTPSTQGIVDLPQ